MVKQLGIIVIPFDNQISEKLDFIREDYHKKNIWFYQYSDFLYRPEKFIQLLRGHFGLTYRTLLYLGLIKNIRLFCKDTKTEEDFGYISNYLESWKINTHNMLIRSGFPFKPIYLDSIIKKKGVIANVG